MNKLWLFCPILLAACQQETASTHIPQPDSDSAAVASAQSGDAQPGSADRIDDELPVQHTIVLKGGKASQGEIRAKIGDTLHIFHDDSIHSHEFYSTDEHYRFDIGTIMDFGDHFDIELDHAKSFEIRCYAMPDMVIEVHVEGDPDDPLA